MTFLQGDTPFCILNLKEKNHMKVGEFDSDILIIRIELASCVACVMLSHKSAFLDKVGNFSLWHILWHTISRDASVLKLLFHITIFVRFYEDTVLPCINISSLGFTLGLTLLPGHDDSKPL